MICPLVGVNSCRPTGAADGGLSIGLGVGLGSGLELGISTRLELVMTVTAVVETAASSVVAISGDGVVMVVEVTTTGADVVGGGEGSPTSIPKKTTKKLGREEGESALPFLTHMSLE